MTLLLVACFCFVFTAVAGAGYCLTLNPRVLERNTLQDRRILAALPAAMEIWAISLDAGHSLDNAIVDGALSLRRAFPQFSRAMLAVHGELRAGKGRPEVFAELARRSGEPELRKVCRLLIDSERFGTSLAPALRAHARYMRNRMRQQAQESARKIGVKLVFPIFFLVFPSVMLITLGPAVLRIFSTLKPMLDGR